MKLRRPTLFLLLMLAALLTFSLNGAALAQDDFSVAMIIAQGGLGDRAGNDLALAGLTLAAQELGIRVVPIESSDPVGEGEQLLRTAAEAGFDMVITIEFTHFDPVVVVANDYPDTVFAIVNVDFVSADNLINVIFDEHTGSYLAGMLSALVTTDESLEQTNDEAVLGAIGGVKSSGIDVFLYGYLQGACAINPETQLLIAYSNGFGDPATGRELTVSMNEQGADVVFQVAGGTGEGVIDAADDGGYFAVGVDSDQDYLAPGSVLTSMLKRFDIAVYDIIARTLAGEALGGTVQKYGLDTNGVGISEMKFTRHIIPREYVDQVNAAREAIIAGELEVIDTRTLDAETFAILDENATCEGVAALKDAVMME